MPSIADRLSLVCGIGVVDEDCGDAMKPSPQEQCSANHVLFFLAYDLARPDTGVQPCRPAP